MNRLSLLLCIYVGFALFLGACNGDGKTSCTPHCEGLECGDDGCGSVCGECFNAADACLGGKCVCQPDCAGKNCGSDGCGGSCGICTSDCPSSCDDDPVPCEVPDFCSDDGTCLTECCPMCEGKDCGGDGCDGSCGICPGIQDYCDDGTCICQSDCTGKTCGTDGCDGSCGECIGFQDECMEGTCKCQPDCEGKVCGADGCSGICGTCSGPQDECVAGECVCQPACEGMNCSDDGCGGLCGICEGAQDQCLDGICTCVPACEGILCGDDGCDGVCGTCTDPDICFEEACCTPQCEDLECGDNLCGGLCGECPGVQDICQDGLCVCIPDCEDKVCGMDGCDGSCGECLPDDVCNFGVCCTPNCLGKSCGDNSCSGFCGNGAWVSEGCTAFYECNADSFLCELFATPDTCGDKQCGADGLGDVCGTCPCPDCPDSSTKCKEFECVTPFGLECHEIFACFGPCEGDQLCIQNCLASGTGQGETLYNNIVNCLDGAGYFDCPDLDEECTEETFAQCMDEYYACFHGDEPCNVLYLCLIGCPGGDSNCSGDCFTSATIDALNSWDIFIDCLGLNGYSDCPPGDSECINTAWDACGIEFKACANGELDCKDVFGCIQACGPWDELCRIGCRVQGTIDVQNAIADIALCVEDNCEPVTGTCEQQVLLDQCSEIYEACLAL
jgi:hypothetical protein